MTEIAIETKEDKACEAECKTPLGHASTKTTAIDDSRHAARNTCGRIGPAGLVLKLALSIDSEAPVSGAEKYSAEAGHKEGDNAKTTSGLSEGHIGIAKMADIENNNARATSLTPGREILAEPESD